MHHVINLSTVEVCAAFARFDDAELCAEKFNSMSNGRSKFVVAAFASGPEIQDWYAMPYRARAMAS